MGVGGQRHAPAALLPGKSRYPFFRKLGGSQGRSGRVREISPPTGIRSPERPTRSESLYRLSYLVPVVRRTYHKLYHRFRTDLTCGNANCEGVILVGKVTEWGKFLL
jgi:hypothetical protein